MSLAVVEDCSAPIVQPSDLDPSSTVQPAVQDLTPSNIPCGSRRHLQAAAAQHVDDSGVRSAAQHGETPTTNKGWHSALSCAGGGTRPLGQTAPQPVPQQVAHVPSRAAAPLVAGARRASVSGRGDPSTAPCQPTSTGLVEVWAGGASRRDMMASASWHDGTKAGLLARTADKIKQWAFLEDQLPHLIPTACEALRGMDRGSISTLVA